MTLRALFRGFTAQQNHVAAHLTQAGRARATRMNPPSARFFSAEAVSHPSNKVQIYISRSTDPYINLSVEQFLLEKSHPDSVVLLLYTNRPCVVIGRNQNPWTEVNLPMLQTHFLGRQPGNSSYAEPGVVLDRGQRGGGLFAKDKQVLLVRRRSGGGTVFHDFGNVNYSVICPSSLFDRNKHAEMVVRALRGLSNEHNVRVNERHDIVKDVDEEGLTKSFKVSGSAYKLTRGRSLHHGTCLLSSPNLGRLSQLLRSPAAPFIKSRGVESVRSSVCNLGIENADFENAVVDEFRTMYESRSDSGKKVDVEILKDDVGRIPEVKAGIATLTSPDWIFAQTPQFTFSSHPTTDDPRPRPELPDYLPAWFFPGRGFLSAEDLKPPGLQMTVRHGVITEVTVPGRMRRYEEDLKEKIGYVGLEDLLRNQRLDEVFDWRMKIHEMHEPVAVWFNSLFSMSSEKEEPGAQEKSHRIQQVD